jgi:hypothetical protein
VVTRDGVVQDAYESELPRVLGMLAAIWQLTLLIQMLGHLREYREPAVPVAAWIGLVVAAGWLIPRSRADGLTRREAAFAIAIAVTAVSLYGWAYRPPGAAAAEDFSVFGTSWLLALVAVSRPAREWVSGALLVLAAHFVFSGHALAFSPRLTLDTASLGLTQIAASGYALAAIGTIFAAIRPTVRTQAGIAVRRSALAARSAAERDAAAAVRDDRRERLALLELEALPLLRGIADGSLDPAVGHVRERCARLAAALRHSLTDRPRDGQGGILRGLEPALRAAGARGLFVDVQVIDDPGGPVPAAARAALEAVISSLPPQQVTLTALAPADDVELYLTFSEPPRTVPDVERPGRDMPAAACWRSAVSIDETGAGCVELCWRKVATARR